MRDLSCKSARPPGPETIPMIGSGGHVLGIQPHAVHLFCITKDLIPALK